MVVEGFREETSMRVLRIGLISPTPTTVLRLTPLKVTQAYPSFGGLTPYMAITMSWVRRFSRTTLVWGQRVIQSWWLGSSVRLREKLRLQESIGSLRQPWRLQKMRGGDVPTSRSALTQTLRPVSWLPSSRRCRMRALPQRRSTSSGTAVHYAVMTVAKQACHSRTWWPSTGRVM